MYVIFLMFSLVILFLLVKPEDEIIAWQAFLCGLAGAFVSIFLRFGGPVLYRHPEINVIVKEIIKLGLFLLVLHLSKPKHADSILAGGTIGVAFASGKILFAVVTGINAEVFFAALALNIMHTCAGIVMAYFVLHKSLKFLSFFVPVTAHFLMMFLLLMGWVNVFLAFIGVSIILGLLIGAAIGIVAKENEERERLKMLYIPEQSGYNRQSHKE